MHLQSARAPPAASSREKTCISVPPKVEVGYRAERHGTGTADVYKTPVPVGLAKDERLPLIKSSLTRPAIIRVSRPGSTKSEPLLPSGRLHRQHLPQTRARRFFVVHRSRLGNSISRKDGIDAERGSEHARLDRPGSVWGASPIYRSGEHTQAVGCYSIVLLLCILEVRRMSHLVMASPGPPGNSIQDVRRCRAPIGKQSPLTQAQHRCQWPVATHSIKGGYIGTWAGQPTGHGWLPV